MRCKGSRRAALRLARHASPALISAWDEKAECLVGSEAPYPKECRTWMRPGKLGNSTVATKTASAASCEPRAAQQGREVLMPPGVPDPGVRDRITGDIGTTKPRCCKQLGDPSPWGEAHGVMTATRRCDNVRRMHPGPQIAGLFRAIWSCALLVTWSTQPLHIFDRTGTEGDGPSQPGGDDPTHVTASSQRASQAGPAHSQPLSGAGTDKTASHAVRLASVNVTSLRGCWDLIASLPFDLLAMQEHH